MRFFAGLSVEQTAHVLQVSPETAMREWQTEDVVVEGTDERLPRTE